MSKKTLVVVGASRGIGEAIVQLANLNDELEIIALSRNVTRMKEQFGDFSNVAFHEIDLADKNLKVQLETIFQNVKHVDYMINNAGKLVNKPFEELTREDISSCYDVNVIGVMLSVQALLPKMNSTHIVNISSVGGFQGSVKFAGLSAYSTSKAAVCSFTELFAEEYKETSIKMNCLCLGAVQTEMLAEAFPGYEAPLTPEQIANYILDFTLTAHQFMNGKIIPVSLSTP